MKTPSRNSRSQNYRIYCLIALDPTNEKKVRLVFYSGLAIHPFLDDPILDRSYLGLFEKTTGGKRRNTPREIAPLPG